MVYLHICVHVWFSGVQIHTAQDQKGIAGLANWLKEKNLVTSDHAIELRTG